MYDPRLWNTPSSNLGIVNSFCNGFHFNLCLRHWNILSDCLVLSLLHIHIIRNWNLALHCLHRRCGVLLRDFLCNILVDGLRHLFRDRYHSCFRYRYGYCILLRLHTCSLFRTIHSILNLFGAAFVISNITVREPARKLGVELSQYTA